jgi:hypothetical protein
MGPVNAAVAAPLQISARLTDTGPVRVYQKVRLNVTLTGGASPYNNPFDPDEVAVDVVLTGPQRQRLTIPGFWTAPYRRQTDSATGGIEVVPADGKPGWEVRFSPLQPGKWQALVYAHDRSGVRYAAPISFSALPAAPGSHGFVRRATGAGSRRYFERSDRTPYFLVGENLCWAGRRGLADYEDWFGALGNAGGNYARLWLANRPLETKETRVGHYDLRHAAYFDEVLSLAERRGIACMLAFGTYGELRQGGFFGEGTWPVSPYNAANGGPVPAASPDAFFTRADARKLYRHRLRYLVARYGAYTSMGFWELWNECDAPAHWQAEMAQYLKAIDPYHRPVTTSYQTTGPATVWNIPAFDLTQTHRYGNDGSLRDIAPGLPGDTHAHDAYKKPHLMGEFGIDWKGTDIKFDPAGTGTNLHNGLWASALSGAAGGASVWWWDSYVHPKRLYPVFTGLAKFAATVDWPRRAFEPLDLPAPTQQKTSGTGTAKALPRDLVLTPEAVWGVKAARPLTLLPGVLPSASAISRSLIGYLYGPAKPDLRNAQQFIVTLAAPGALKIRVQTVSDKSDLRVTVDGVPVANLLFDPTPTGAGTYKSTKAFPEYGGLSQAQFDTVRVVPLSAGNHTIRVEAVAGDWILVSEYAFAGALPQNYTPLRTTALQDAVSAETLLWVQDPASNWKSDAQGKAPPVWNNTSLVVPVPQRGAYRVDWWDTRTGRILRTDRAAISGQAQGLTLTAPPFRRDIAARITATSKTKEANGWR